MTPHWLSETFKHRRREETHEVAFWNENHASDEAEATRATVVVKMERSYSTQLAFKWPEEKANVDALETMLRRAFEIGRHDAKREIREVLGLARS